MISRRFLAVRFVSTGGRATGSAAGTESASTTSTTSTASSDAPESTTSTVRNIQEMLMKNDITGAAQTYLGLTRKDLAPDSHTMLKHHHGKFINHFTSLEPRELEPVLPMVWKLQSKFIELGRVVPDACTKVMLLALQVGEPERAIELWVHLLETLARRSRKEVKDIVSEPYMASCALAALAAYFVSCNRRGIPIDTDTALKLVPLKTVPVSLGPLYKMRGQRLDPETMKIVKEGLSTLRKSAADFSSPEYLDLIAKANQRDTHALYKEALEHEDLPEAVYAVFIRRFAETRESDMAFKVWNTLVEKSAAKQTKPTVVGWRALLRAGSLAPANAKVMVDMLWAEMIKAGIEPDADCWCVRLESLIRANMVADAVKLFKEVQPKTDLGVYGMNIVVTGLVNTNKFDEAEELLASLADQIKPNGVTYNALIAAAVRAHQTTRAHEYLDKMAAAKISPDIVTYSQLLHALFTAKGANGATTLYAVESILTEMKARKIVPNAQFYTILAHGIANLTEGVALARRLYTIMLKAQLPLSVETFGALIDGEIKHGDYARAKYYFDQMPKHGLPYATSNYNQMIAGALARSDIETADKLFTSMLQRSRTQPNVFTFMFLLRKWKPADLEKQAVADLVSRALSKLADRPDLLDYSLAQRVLELGPKLSSTSPELLAAAERTAAQQFQAKVANRSRRQN